MIKSVLPSIATPQGQFFIDKELLDGDIKDGAFLSLHNRLVQKSKRSDIEPDMEDDIEESSQLMAEIEDINDYVKSHKSAFQTLSDCFLSFAEKDPSYEVEFLTYARPMSISMFLLWISPDKAEDFGKIFSVYSPAFEDKALSVLYSDDKGRISVSFKVALDPYVLTLLWWMSKNKSSIERKLRQYQAGLDSIKKFSSFIKNKKTK